MSSCTFSFSMLFSLVIPTYNERASVGPVIEEATRALGAAGIPFEIVVVDDDSPDGTAEAARRALGDRGRVVVRAGERGLASAIMAGFRESRGEILGTMDADGSHPAGRIPDFLAPIRAGEADFVIASRYVPGGETQEWPAKRLFLSRAANGLARLLTPVRDATSGCFFLRRSVIDGLDLPPRGFKICLEILVRGRFAKSREVPYRFIDRKAGASKMTPGVGLDYLVQVGKLLSWRVRNGGARTRSE